MKRLLIVLVIVLLFLAGCTQSSQSQPQPNIPKYNVNQVISIVQAQYPVAYKHQSTGKDASGMFIYVDVQTPPSISASFIGGTRGAWRVEIKAPPTYFLARPLSGISSKTLYFYESNGSLGEIYYP